MSDRPYHHGRLRQAIVQAAVSEVEAVGASAVSMREIARRAGVSHAAPAHHFGDKAGIFTAIATEGFRLTAEAIGPTTDGAYGFLDGGTAYVAFALGHPGYFEVMYRPALYRADDPDLVAAREAAFAILDGSAAATARQWGIDDPAALTLAGWSIAHGLATLALAGNLTDRLPPDPDGIQRLVRDGMIALGGLAARQAGATGD